jgi:small-conductance mechanosensitive channel
VSGQTTGEQPDPGQSKSAAEGVEAAGPTAQAGAETQAAPGAHAGPEAQAAAIAEVEAASSAAAVGSAGSGSGSGVSAAGAASAKQAVAAQAGVKHAAEKSKTGSRVHQIEPDEHSPLAVLNNAISANFRRALLATLLACVGLGLTYISGGVLNNGSARVDFFTKHNGLGQIAAIVGAVLFLVFGIVAVRSATKEILKTVPPSLDDNRKNGLRWVCLLVGYLFVIFGTLGALNVPIERLLVGGAVTGVILGIAAQQSLGNLFAGLMLLLTRPFAIGDEISLRSGPLGGVLTGLVADMNLTYVKLVTDNGTVLLPNSSILTAVVGPPGAFG